MTIVVCPFLKHTCFNTFYGLGKYNYQQYESKMTKSILD